MRYLIIRYLLVYTILFCSFNSSFAKVKLPSIISDGMVLQQRSEVRLWGLSAPLGKVSIHPSWSKKIYTTMADHTGAWETFITTAKAGGPYRISLNDGEELVLNNVLLGEVWLCSGQSNMVMPLKGYQNQPVLNSAELIATSSNKFIRVFEVPKLISAMPLKECKGNWKESNPENAANFSAIAYQYAKTLNEKLHVPIGVIVSSWGSTAIQSWMGESNLKQFPDQQTTSRPDTMKIPAKDPELLTAGLFNAMIAPVTKYAIKGFLWYQGESNKNPLLYQKLLPAMVKEWRNAWARGNLPFYYVQIAPYKYQDRNTAFLREAQLNADISNSGMVVSLDAGEANRIHPPDKTIISQRLAQWALAQTYKQKYIACKSPQLRSVRFRSGTAVLIFKDVYMGLKAKNNQLANFEMAGADGVFYPAKAVITGLNKVLTTCDRILQPVAVRYAFKNWANAELNNSENLPLSSFRTDKF